MAGVDIASERSMTTALAALDTAQQKVALSALQRAGVDTKQIAINLEKFKSENLMTVSMAKNIAFSTAYTDGIENEIAADIESVAATRARSGSVEGLSAAELKGVLVKRGVTEATAEEIVASATATTAKGVEAKTTDLLTASLWKNIKAVGVWLATSPVGMLLVVAGAIYGVVKATDYANAAYDRSIERLEEIRSKIEEQKAEYDRLTAKVADGTITSVEKERLAILQAQTAELERQEKKEANKAANEYSDKKVKRSEVHEAGVTDSYGSKSKYTYTGYDTKTNEEWNQKLIDSYKGLDKSSSTYEADLAKLSGTAAEYLEEQESWIHTADNVTDEQLDQYDALLAIVEESNVLKEAQDGVSESTNNLASSVKSLSDTFKDLSTAKDDISNLSTAFKELSEGDGVSFSTLSKIQESFGESVPEIENYIDALASAKGNTEETAQILGDLTYASLDAKLGTEGLANATECTITAMLKEAGVANADEVATYALAKAKVQLKMSSAIASGGISALIGVINAEAGTSIYAKNELFALAMQQIATSNTTMNFSQQISALCDLASAANLAAASVGNVMAGAERSVKTYMRQKGMSREEAEATVKQGYVDAYTSKLRNSISNMPKPQYGGGGYSGGGSSGGGNGGGGSAQKVEEYKVEIDKLYESNKRLKDIQDKIAHLETLSDMTDDAKEQLKYLNQIVVSYKDEQEALHDISELRREDIKANIKELSDNGFDISYDASTNNLLIKNMEHLNELGKDSGLTQKQINNLRKSMEELISTTIDLNEANKESSKQWWTLEKQLKSIKDKYNDIADIVKETYEATIDAVLKVIEKEKEALEKNQDIFKKQKSDLETTVSTVVSFIDKQIEALRNENDELDRQIEAQEKLEALERAKSQRIHRIYREGEGYGWDVDHATVNKARQDYDKFLREKELNDQISKLEEYKKTWEDVVDSYQKGVDEKITAAKLGDKWREVILNNFKKGVDEQIAAEQENANWFNIILNQKGDSIQKFADEYSQINSELDEDVEGSTANQIKNLDDLADKWSDASDEIEEAIDEHKEDLDLLKNFEEGNYNQRLDILKEFVKNYSDELKKISEASEREALSTAETIERMKQNSLEWFTASPERRKELERENQEYGENLDWNYNSASGKWDDGWGNPAYSARDDALSRMKDNAASWTPENGANLAAENQKIGSSLGLSYNSASGEWFNPDGSRAFSDGGVADFTGIATLHGATAAELILNNADTGKLYDYIHTSPSLVQDMINEVAIGKLTPIKSSAKPISKQSVSLSIGQMHLHEVQDVDGLSSAIIKELPGKFEQELYERD